MRKSKFPFATASENGYGAEEIILTGSQNYGYLLLHKKTHTSHWDPTAGRRRKSKQLPHTLQRLVWVRKWLHTHQNLRTFEFPSFTFNSLLHVSIFLYMRYHTAGLIKRLTKLYGRNPLGQDHICQVCMLPFQRQQMPSNSQSASLTYLSRTTLQPGGTHSHQAPCTAPPHLCRLFQGWPAPQWSAAHCYWGTLSETSGKDKGNSTWLLYNTKSDCTSESQPSH